MDGLEIHGYLLSLNGQSSPNVAIANPLLTICKSSTGPLDYFAAQNEHYEHFFPQIPL
jgi:hypothetical protein